jgi:NADH-quinone oxidoreductase subunit H
MVTSSAFLVTLFFGGYHLPFVELTHPEAAGILAVLVKFAVFYSKVMLVLCFMMLVRWTLPRVRYDQVLKLCWSSLIPIAMAIVVATSVMVFLGWTATWQMFLMNLALGVVIMVIAPLMPKQDVNHRIPLAGSRFSPLPGEHVITGAAGLHTDDDPYAGLSKDPRGGLVTVQ